MAAMQAAAKKSIEDILCHASAAGGVFVVDDLDYTDAVSMDILRVVIGRCRAFTGLFSCGSLLLDFARAGLKDEAGGHTAGLRGQVQQEEWYFGKT